MKKKFLLLFFALMCSAANIQAKNIDESISVHYRNISLNIDNTMTDLFDASGNYIEPFLYNNTTYLPLRAVAQALNMSVSWDAETYQVGLSVSQEKTENPTGQKQSVPAGAIDISVNYRDISVALNGTILDLKNANGENVEPFLYQNTVYLPLRNIAEATSSEVSWDGENSIISIISKSSVSSTAPYDTEADSDWTYDEAVAYGYQVDFNTYSDRNYAYIQSYTGTETDILIPAKINGKTTYLLGEASAERNKTFEGNEQLTTVTFESGVVVGNYHNLFRSCKQLRAVYNLPDGIGGAATFSGCNNLEYLSNIPDALTHMNSFVYNAKQLHTIEKIPANVTTVDSAFANCTNLTGEIICDATNIKNAKNAFLNTEKPITLHVPYPSLTYTTLSESELPENITLKQTENRIAYLPKELYVATDVPITFYNEAIAPLYADKQFRWTCTIGTATKKGFSLSPTEAQVGEYPISVEIMDGSTVLYKAESLLKIISSRTLSKTLSLTTLSQNVTLGTNTWLKTVQAYTERIFFRGTRSNKHEARSAFTTESYLYAFEYDKDSYGLDKKNPFFNPSTQSFDWSYYKGYVDFNVNAPLFFLPPSGTPERDLTTMIDSIRSDSPQTPIFIASPIYRTGASQSLDLSYFSYMLILDELEEKYDNLYLIPTALTFDRSLNYNEKNKSLPNEEGYAQIGRTIFSTLAYYLQ